jgi:hypothetical protein
MPTLMKRFDLDLATKSRLALGIVEAGELSRIDASKRVSKEWTRTRLEALYELAYLHAFAEWEADLEAVFIRSVCGHASRYGRETLVTGAYSLSLAHAETRVLGGGDFLLWHDPDKVIKRCKRFFVSGSPGCPARQETTIAANLARLVDLASIRHRIVHTHQTDAKNKFDAATLNIAARTFQGSRPGVFLRSWDSSAPPRRWLEVLIGQLIAMMSLMV